MSQTSFSPATSALHRLVEPHHPRLPTLMYKLRTQFTYLQTCSPMSVHLSVRKYVDWCPKHQYNVRDYICNGVQDTCLVHTTFSAKNAHTPAQVRLCDGAAISLPRKSLQTLNYLERWVLPKKPSKSTPAHDAVAVALLHRHYLIIHVGTGRIQLANGSPSLLSMEATHNRSLFSPIFPQKFLKSHYYQVKSPDSIILAASCTE